jgi:hypothetical protein
VQASPLPALAQPKAGISSGLAPMNLHPWHQINHLQITRFGLGNSARWEDEQIKREIGSPIHHNIRARRYTHQDRHRGDTSWPEPLCITEDPNGASPKADAHHEDCGSMAGAAAHRGPRWCIIIGAAAIQMGISALRTTPPPHPRGEHELC